MDNHRLNRWLTLGANIGVLIGLLLLILELRQNHEIMRAQIKHDLAMGLVTVTREYTFSHDDNTDVT